MTRTPQNLIDLLKRELEEKSFAQIGKATGIGTASLHGYANGTSEVAAQNMGKLAEYFGVEVDFLLGAGLYRNLGGSNKIDVAKRFKANVKERLVFEKFIGTRLDEIAAAGDKRSKTALIQFSEDMDRLKQELLAERQELFADLEAAFERIPDLLKKDAVILLAEKIK
jgi:transcriptional regulator with XRE-family HTH domain